MHKGFSNGGIPLNWGVVYDRNRLNSISIMLPNDNARGKHLNESIIRAACDSFKGEVLPRKFSDAWIELSTGDGSNFVGQPIYEDFIAELSKQTKLWKPNATREAPQLACRDLYGLNSSPVSASSVGRFDSSGLDARKVSCPTVILPNCDMGPERPVSHANFSKLGRNGSSGGQSI